MKGDDAFASTRRRARSPARRNSTALTAHRRRARSSPDSILYSTDCGGTKWRRRARHAFALPRGRWPAATPLALKRFLRSVLAIADRRACPFTSILYSGHSSRSPQCPHCRSAVAESVVGAQRKPATRLRTSPRSSAIEMPRNARAPFIVHTPARSPSDSVSRPGAHVQVRWRAAPSWCVDADRARCGQFLRQLDEAAFSASSAPRRLR